MTTTQDRQLLFVVGMHRSGTSALCAALRACGAQFGEQLLAPQDGVNDEGFWEDARVVAINEQLLAELGHCWYSVSPELAATDWRQERFATQRQAARAVVQQRFGAGPLDALKDPRFCITLGFWLDLCRECSIKSQVCAITRAPLEVARSLEKRDGFPPGYGLRLYLAYWQTLQAAMPADALYIAYDQLLEDAAAVMEQLSAVVSLEVNTTALADAVRTDLRHQHEAEGGLLNRASIIAEDWAPLAAEIETSFPLDDTLREMARGLVQRGMQLTALGERHSAALSVVDERDAQIVQLGKELQQAEAVITERDAQIGEFDRRLLQLGEEHSHALETIHERDAQITGINASLAKLGEEHAYALSVVRERDEQLGAVNERLAVLGADHSHAQAVVAERDQQLQHMSGRVQDMEHRLNRILNKPGLGLVFKKLWFYEKG